MTSDRLVVAAVVVAALVMFGGIAVVGALGDSADPNVGDGPVRPILDYAAEQCGTLEEVGAEAFTTCANELAGRTVSNENVVADADTPLPQVVEETCGELAAVGSEAFTNCVSALSKAPPGGRQDTAVNPAGEGQLEQSVVDSIYASCAATSGPAPSEAFVQCMGQRTAEEMGVPVAETCTTQGVTEHCQSLTQRPGG